MESTVSTVVNDKSSNPNILKTLKCIVSSVSGESTNNGTKYTRTFWETVLKNPRLQSLLRNKTLFGELDHPEDSRSVETMLSNAAIAFTELDIEGTDVVGTFDILNTPAGKIVESLTSAGCNIGLSIRGVGTIGYDGVVSPNNYYLHGIDVVSDPSHQPARMIGTISESSKPRRSNAHVILESVKHEIANASEESKLTTINDIVSRLTLDEDSKQLLTDELAKKSDELSSGNQVEQSEDSSLMTLIEKVNDLTIGIQNVSEERDQVVAAYQQLVEKNINESVKASEEYVTVKKADLKELREYCKSLQDDVLTLETLANTKTEELAEKQIRIEEVNERLEESMTAMGYKVGEIDKLQTTVGVLKSDLLEKEDQLNAYKQKHDDLLKGYAEQRTAKSGVVVTESYKSKEQFDRLFERAKINHQLEKLPNQKSNFSDLGDISFDYIETNSEYTDLAALAGKFQGGKINV